MTFITFQVLWYWFMVTRAVQPLREPSKHVPEPDCNSLPTDARKFNGKRCNDFRKHLRRVLQNSARLQSKHGQDGFHQFIDYQRVLFAW